MKRPQPYDKTTHDGKTVDWLTKAALLEMERRLGYPLTVVQGSYHKGVSQSAGTHDGGGVVDLAPWDWKNKVRVGRRDGGFVAYHRPELWRNGEKVWNEHIHMVLMGNKAMSNAARDQVNEYYAGEDALADHGPDPHPWRVREFSWPYFGMIGRARWQRDQLAGAARRSYVNRLRKVLRGEKATSGLVGLVAAKRDRLHGKRRTAYLAELRRVIRGK